MIKISVALLFAGTTFLSFAQCPEFSIDFEISTPLCHDSDDGSITLTTSGGEEPYVYEIKNEAGELVNDLGTNVAMDLGGGTYTFTITDNSGCDTSNVITIEAPTPFVFSDFGSEDLTEPSTGVIYMAGTGGTPSYSYLWTSIETGATVTNTTWGGLDVGCYIGVATDANGCEITDTVCLGWLNIESADLTKAKVTYSGQTKNLSLTFKEPFQLNIYSINGQLLFTKNCSEGIQNIPLELDKGIYIYEVKSNQGIVLSGRLMSY